MSEYCAEKGSALMCMWEGPLTLVPLYTAFVALADGYRSSPTPDSNELWIRIKSSGAASAVSSAKTNLVSSSTVSDHCISGGHVQRRLCSVKHREILALLTQALDSQESQSITSSRAFRPGPAARSKPVHGPDAVLARPSTPSYTGSDSRGPGGS